MDPLLSLVQEEFAGYLCVCTDGFDTEFCCLVAQLHGYLHQLVAQSVALPWLMFITSIEVTREESSCPLLSSLFSCSFCCLHNYDLLQIITVVSGTYWDKTP